MQTNGMDGALESRLKEIDKLPSLPTVMIDALKVANDPDSNIQALYNVVKNDAVISAKVLSVVNSAYYGLSKDVTSLQMALVVLGMQEVVRLILSVSVVRTYSLDELTNGFSAKDYWVHNIFVGEVASALGKKIHVEQSDELFTVGLLHDIGRLPLLVESRNEYLTCLARSERNSIPLLWAERETFGLDHARIGGYLAERWELGEMIRECIQYHHEPERAREFQKQVAVVYLANRIAKMAGVSIDKNKTEGSLFVDEAWKIIDEANVLERDQIVAEMLAKVDEIKELGNHLLG